MALDDFTDCGGGLCSQVGGLCDACIEALSDTDHSGITAPAEPGPIGPQRTDQ